jgi:hypothetical protein
MGGDGAHADLIGIFFRTSARRLKIDGPHPGLSTEHFRRPGQAQQLSLFD